MKSYILLGLLILNGLLYAEPVCQKCEVIREYNKEHPGDYEYYEDYLKAKEQEDQES